MLRTLLPLLIILSTTAPLGAQQQPEKLKGLLWEISGNGISKPGYLYGTMHVPEKLAFNLSDSFFVALRQADMLALETDHDRWQAFTEILDGRESELFNPQYSSEDGSATQPNLYNAQFDFSSPGNPLLGALISAKPRMTNEFLYRSNQYRQDYEEDTYLDLFIFQAGRKLGKTVIGLETLEGSYEALVRAQIPDDEAAPSSDRGHYPGSLSRLTLEDAYREQDLSMLDSLNKMSRPGKNFQRWMLDERNAIMAHGIDSVLQHGTSLFSAVGAAHLPGETGVIRLLREKGYTLRPVQFSANFSKKEKETIEALRYPVHLSRQWSADASWSVEAPGKFFQTVDGNGLEQYLCADMSNGAYYAVYRLLTFGLWNGQPAQYIADRIDSLIYEKIPGKILERKRFQEPFPGHEITTRTRRGDLMRYKIIVTPMEVLVFATGGNGDYVAGEEGTRFITSIQLHGPPDAPASANGLFSPPQGGFRVALPGTLLLNTTADRLADHYLLAAQEHADSSFYLVCRGVFHDWDFIEEDTFELNIIGERITAQFSKSQPQIALMATSPYPTQDVSFRSNTDSAWYFLRLIIDGPRYYLLGCRKYTPGAPAAFFDSFAITPMQYPEGWQTLRDTQIMFEAPVPRAALKPEQPFVEKLRRIIQEGFQKNSRRSTYADGIPRRQSRWLGLPLQGEKVSVQSLELPVAGTTPTLDSFKLFITRRLTHRSALAVGKQRWDAPSPRLLVGDFLLEDTNSTRGIRTKVFLTPGRLYILSATTSLHGPPSTFTDSLFAAFTPTDTTGGTLPFGRRNLDFLQEIYAADSLVRDKALSRLSPAWVPSSEARDFAAVRTAIAHPKFSQLRFAHREILLASLGQFNTPEALRFALDFAQGYPDSLRYQQILLGVLASMQTRPAHKALMERLKQEATYVSGNALSDIFDALQDSLKLSVHVLPDLLGFADQEAFREPVMRLLEAAVRSELINPRRYARLKPRLIRESFWQLKKQQLNEEEKLEAVDGEDYMFSGSAYDSDGNLQRNLRLLAPFIRRDAKVRAVFEQAARSADKEIQVMAYCLMLRGGYPVRQETLRVLAADDRTCYMLYRHLLETGQLAEYEDWFADSVALVRSILTEDLTARAGRNKADAPDSIRFISCHPTLRWGSPAVMYFFDLKTKKDKRWQLAYVTVPAGVQPVGDYPQRGIRPVSLYEQGASYRLRPEVKIVADLSEQEKAEFIRKRIGETRFVNRKRYQRWDSRDEYF